MSRDLPLTPSGGRAAVSPSLKPGDRVRYSAKWLETARPWRGLKPEDVRGKFIRYTVQGFAIVCWDHCRSFGTFHASFIELDAGEPPEGVKP
jgi:hypothetical protein